LPTAAASARDAFELLRVALQSTSVREGVPQLFVAAHESGLGTTPTGPVQRMKCAIGGEADIPATQRFFVQGPHAQGDRHLNASGTRFIPEKLLGLFERTTWPVV
jgi:hypothetical protein